MDVTDCKDPSGEREMGGVHDQTLDSSARNPDLLYFEKGRGICSVDRDRWAEAQGAERDLWMKEGLWWTDDRNLEHERHFDGYQVLKGRSFDRALEIGCGPFTNARRVLRSARVNSVALLDPLLDTYLDHPGSRYSRRRLILDSSWPPPIIIPLALKLRMASSRLSRWTLDIAKRLLPRQTIPIDGWFPCGAEELVQESRFDLIILINVLEHCYDAERLFANLRRSLTPSGVIVFHDRLYDTLRPLDFYDPYHPLRIAAPVIEEFLSSFDPLFRRDLPPESQGEEKWPRVYFVGRK